MSIQPSVSVSADELLNTSDNLLVKWEHLDDANKARWAEKIALLHFRKAQIYAENSDYNQAAQELIEEIKTQELFDGRIEHAAKSSDAFFEELITLQALVTAETGNDPLAGQVGYFFEKDGDGFTAARLELGDDVAGITVPEIGVNEALALVHRLNKQGGRFVATAPRWLVVPKGKLLDVLEQATREVAFDADGRMIVHNLKAQAKPSPKADPSAAGDTASQQVPSHVQPPAPKKPTEQKPAPATLWPMIAAVIMVAMGMLWLLLKKRK